MNNNLELLLTYLSQITAPIHNHSLALKTVPLLRLQLSSAQRSLILYECSHPQIIEHAVLSVVKIEFTVVHFVVLDGILEPLPGDHLSQPIPGAIGTIHRLHYLILRAKQAGRPDKWQRKSNVVGAVIHAGQRRVELEEEHNRQGMHPPPFD